MPIAPGDEPYDVTQPQEKRDWGQLAPPAVAALTVAVFIYGSVRSQSQEPVQSFDGPTTTVEAPAQQVEAPEETPSPPTTSTPADSTPGWEMFDPIKERGGWQVFVAGGVGIGVLALSALAMARRRL